MIQGLTSAELAGLGPDGHTALHTFVALPSAELWLAGSSELGVVAGLRPSSWDSELLGFGVALGPSPVVFGEDDLDVGELAAVLGTKLLERTRDLGCRLLSFRADCKELGISWGFQRAGFVVADTNVQFRMHITDELLEPLRAPGQCCSAALPEDREAVLAMARIFRSDHFHADQRVPRQRADDLYAQWVDNSLTGRADEVLVVRDEGTAIGFITCRLFSERGVIELVGASPSSRGRGVGLALVAGAVSWFHRHGATVVDVGTQVSNVAACRVYQRAGFASVAYGNTFHGWADD